MPHPPGNVRTVETFYFRPHKKFCQNSVRYSGDAHGSRQWSGLG